MQKKLLIIFMTLVLVILSLLVACQSTPSQLTLRFTSVGPPPPSVMGIPFEYFENRVTNLSGGAITFENFWSGSLLSANESLEGIQKRVADLGMGLPLFFPTQLPLSTFDANFPFCPSDLELSAQAKLEMYERVDAFNEEYENNGIKPLMMYSSGSYDLQSNVPMPTLADLDGAKIAAAGATLPKWLEPIGAVPVSMPGADRYVSLQRKTIDGSFLPMSSAEGDRHYEVAKHYTYTDLGAPAIMYLWVSQDLWDSLSSSQRKIMLQAAEETQEWLPTEFARQQAECVATFEDAGVTFYTMSDADKAAWAQALPDLPAQWAEEMEAQGLPGWEIVETYMEITEEAGYVWPREWGQR